MGISLGPIPRIQTPSKVLRRDVAFFGIFRGDPANLVGVPEKVRITHASATSPREDTYDAQGCSHLHKCCMNMLHIYELSCRLAMSAANAESAHH